MASLRELIVKISADTSGFEKGIHAAQKQALALSERFGTIGNTLTTSLTLPLGLAAGAAIKAFGDIDSLKRGLIAVTGSAQAANRQLEQLREVAKLPGLGLREAVQGAINLQAVGLSADQSRRVLIEFGNALATVGRGREDLSEVIRQLGQLSSRGKITADNLKPLIERVPQLAQIIKQQFGPEAIGDPAKTFERLGISSQQFIDIVLRELSKMPRTTGGIQNAFENLRDSVNDSLARIGEKLAPTVEGLLPKLEGMAAAAARAAESFSRLPGAIQSVALAVGGLVLAAGPGAKVAEGISKLGVLLLALTRLPVPHLLALGSGLTVVSVLVGKFISSLSGSGDAVTATKEKVEDFSQAVANLGITVEHVSSAKSISLDEAFKNLGAPRVSKELSELRQSIDVVRTAFRNKQISIDDLRAATVAYEKQNEKLKKSMGEVKVSALTIEDAFRKLGATLITAELAELERNMDVVRRAFATNTITLHEYLNAFDAYQNQMDRLSVNNQITAQSRYTDVLNETIITLERLRLASSQFGEIVIPIRTEDIRIPTAERLRGTPLEVEQILGPRAQTALNRELQKAQENLSRITELKERGQATDRDILRAQEDLRIATERTNEVTTESVRKKTAEASVFARQVSTIVTDLSRGITDVISRAKTLGEVFQGIAIDISRALLRYAIEQGIKVLINALSGALSKLGSFGRAISDVFGGISTGTQAKKAAPGADNIGQLASGALGAVNTIGTITNAVFSALQLVQGRRMEVDIGRIEVTSRGQLSQLQSIQERLDTYLPNLTRLPLLESINAGIEKIYLGLAQIDFFNRDQVTQTSNAPITININTSAGTDGRDLAQMITRELRLVSRAFA